MPTKSSPPKIAPNTTRENAAHSKGVSLHAGPSADGEASNDPQRRRGVPIMVISAVACSLVMGVVVAFALSSRKDDSSSTLAGVRRTSPGSQSGALEFTGLCGGADRAEPVLMKFDVPGNVLDFGPVTQNATVQREVTFRNIGRGPLCIHRVRASCGCYRVILISTKRRYEPGEEGQLRITLVSGGREGIVKKRVIITTNDVKRPEKMFHVKADVSLGVLMRPATVQFGKWPVGVPAEAMLVMKTLKSGPDWKILDVAGIPDATGTPPPKITYSVSKQDDSKWHIYNLKIQRPAVLESGMASGFVRVKTTHPDHSEFRLRSSLYAVHRISLNTQRITLGYVKHGEPSRPEPASRVYLVPSGPSVKFKLTGARVEPAEGTQTDPRGTGFSVKTGVDRRGSWAEVNYDGTAFEPGILEAKLVMTTDDEQQPSLSIPVRATVRGR